MSGHYGNDQPDEIVPGLILPASVLWSRNGPLAWSNGWNLSVPCWAADCERLNLLIDEVTAARLQQLEQQGLAR